MSPHLSSKEKLYDFPESIPFLTGGGLSDAKISKWMKVRGGYQIFFWWLDCFEEEVSKLKMKFEHYHGEVQSRHQRSMETLILLHRSMETSLEISSESHFKIVVAMGLPQKTLKLSETLKSDQNFENSWFWSCKPPWFHKQVLGPRWRLSFKIAKNTFFQAFFSSGKRLE